MAPADSEVLSQQFFRFSNGAPTRSHLTRGRYLGRDTAEDPVEDSDDDSDPGFDGDDEEEDPDDVGGAGPAAGDKRGGDDSDDDEENEADGDEQEASEHDVVHREKNKVVSQGVKSNVIKSFVADELKLKAPHARYEHRFLVIYVLFFVYSLFLVFILVYAWQLILYQHGMTYVTIVAVMSL